MFRGLVLVAVLLTACGDHVGSGGVSGLSPSPGASAATLNPKPTPAPTIPLPTAPTVAFPNKLAFAVGTYDGLVYPELVDGKPAGTPVRGCDGQVSNLAAYGRLVLIVCREPTYRLSIFDVDAGTLSVVPGVQALEAVWTTLGDAVVYTAIGKAEGPAPIPMTKLMYRDLRTGQTTQIDERFGVGNDLRSTGEGVTVWRGTNMDSFIRSADQAGTWVIRGTELIRFSQHRLIDGGKGRDLLETDGTTSSIVACCTAVVSRYEQEQRITPLTVPHERAVALLEDGRIVAFRPDTDDLFEGSVVVYRGGVVERSGRGKFTAYRAVRDLDWIVGIAVGGSDPRLRAYRLSDGAFAGASGNITALAHIGPKK